MPKNIKYNFKKINSIQELYRYYDNECVVALYIFKSGWKNKYNCVLEWGEYGTSESNVYNAEEIKYFYGINLFLRKEKLIKINESTL